MAQFSASGDTARFELTGVSIPKDSTHYWLVAYNFAGSAAKAATFRPRLAQGADVTAEGKASTNDIAPSKPSRGELTMEEVTADTSSDVILLPPEIPVNVALVPNATADTSANQGRLGRAAFSTVNGAQATVYRTGTLTLATGANNPAARLLEVSSDTTVLQLRLTADNVEDLTVTEIQLVGVGTTQRATEIENVKIYYDANGNGALDNGSETPELGTGTFASNDTLTFTGLSFSVPQNSSRNIIAAIQTSALGMTDHTFSVHMKGDSYVTATGSTSGLELTTTYKNVPDSLTSQNHSFRKGQITVSRVDLSPAGSDTGLQNLAVMRLTFSASGPRVAIDSLRVDNYYSDTPLMTYAVADMESLKVYKDNGNSTWDGAATDSFVVGTNFVASAIPGGSAYAKWGQPDTLRDGTTTEYFLIYDFAQNGAGDPTHGWGAELVDSTYVNAVAGELLNTNFTLRLSAEKSLPVELTSFTSVVLGQNVKLLWTTESETNNNFWVIERALLADEEDSTIARAKPAVAWEEIHRMPGMGTRKFRTNYKFFDVNVEFGARYAYRLVDVSTSGVRTAHPEIEVIIGRPAELALSAAWPNPANPATSWTYALPNDVHVRMVIYNIYGQQIRVLVDGQRPAGIHRVSWNGTDELGRQVASGVYVYVLQTPGNHRLVRRVTIVK